MKKFYIASLFVMLGCSHSEMQPAVPNLPDVKQEAPKAKIEPPLPDLKLISKDNWSFAVPSDYEELAISPNNTNAGVKVFLKSKDEHTAIIFGSEKTNQSIVEYVFDVGRNIQEHGMEIINVYDGNLGERNAKLILFAASPTTAGANFIVIVDGSVYSLTCYTLIEELSNKTCMKIARTLEVK